MARTFSIGLTALAAVVSPASAGTPTAPQPPSPANYLVEVAMTEGDAPATHPRLLVRAGETATFMIGNERYGLRMTAETGTDGRVVLRSSVATWTSAGLRHHEANVSLAADGEHGLVAFPITDPANGATREVRLDVTVRPTG